MKYCNTHARYGRRSSPPQHWPDASDGQLPLGFSPPASALSDDDTMPENFTKLEFATEGDIEWAFAALSNHAHDLARKQLAASHSRSAVDERRLLEVVDQVRIPMSSQVPVILLKNCSYLPFACTDLIKII